MPPTDSLDAIEMMRLSRQDIDDTPEILAYRDLLSTVRGFLDSVVQANPSQQVTERLTEGLEEFTAVLEAQAVPERDRWHGRGNATKNRRLLLMPPELVTDHHDDTTLKGHTTVGEFYLGMNQAIHGGIVATIMDTILGGVVAGPSEEDFRVARTAYLNTNYRSVTPINERLDYVAQIDEIDGRKIFCSAKIYHGDTLCAESDALFVLMLPGQS